METLATLPMKHQASGNWKNQRKDPMKGIQTAPPPANRNQVRALLSGTIEEAIGFVWRHVENEPWLKIAEELESERRPQRPEVLQAIRDCLTQLRHPDPKSAAPLGRPVLISMADDCDFPGDRRNPFAAVSRRLRSAFEASQATWEDYKASRSADALEIYAIHLRRCERLQTVLKALPSWA